jgi:hypothetical protein
MMWKASSGSATSYNYGYEKSFKIITLVYLIPLLDILIKVNIQTRSSEMCHCTV